MTAVAEPTTAGPDDDVAVAATEERPVVELWAYAGVRYAAVEGPGRVADHRLVDEWSANRGITDTSLWTIRRLGGQKYVVGGIYNVRVIRDGDRVLRKGPPIFTGRRMDERTCIEWSAADDKARLDRQRAIDMSRAVRADPLDDALRPLQELFASRRTRPEREALLVAIMARLLAP